MTFNNGCSTQAVPEFQHQALAATRSSVVSGMFKYELANGTSLSFSLPDQRDTSSLRERETVRISVVGEGGGQTAAVFEARTEMRRNSLVSLLSTLFIIIVWFFGVTAFAGPVKILVVIHIERRCVFLVC